MFDRKEKNPFPLWIPITGAVPGRLFYSGDMLTRAGAGAISLAGRALRQARPQRKERRRRADRFAAVGGSAARSELRRQL